MPQKPKLVIGTHYLVNPINVTIIKFLEWPIFGIILDEFITSKRGSLCNTNWFWCLSHFCLPTSMLLTFWSSCCLKFLTLKFVSKVCKKANCLSLHYGFSQPRNSIIITNYLIMAIFNPKLVSNNHHQIGFFFGVW